MKNLSQLQRMLPAFPRTPHLPYRVNATADDEIAIASEALLIYDSPVNIEEKVDGASVGMTLFEDNPVIRNRDHILRKGYVKDTAAKKQFTNAWNWFYENKKKFEALVELGPYAVYGEWCWARHGIIYDRLPDWFVAYDIYDWERDYFLAPPLARQTLGELGFALPRLLHQGDVRGDYAELGVLTEETSAFGVEQVEGIYLKVYDDKQVTHRFKMVRPTFERGKHWDAKKLTKNKVA